MKLRLIFLSLLYLSMGAAFADDLKKSSPPKLEKATFAGGCFWCMEPPFEDLKGVKSVISGFSGGEKKNPGYKEVATGQTKHKEVVQITFDPSIVSYAKLLEIYWKNVNPTDAGGQFVDRGAQYSTGIYFHSDTQKKEAIESKKAHEKNKTFGKPIVTPIEKFKSFYAAEEYHQDYYKKNPIRYKYYRYNSGRDRYLNKIWGSKK